LKTLDRVFSISQKWFLPGSSTKFFIVCVSICVGASAGKHPVSVLNELCSKRHWPPPRFDLMEEIGPAHHKSFRFKVQLLSLCLLWLLLKLPAVVGIKGCI